MSLCNEKIEHLEYWWRKGSDKPWKNYSRSRKWRKNQRNRLIRRVKQTEIPNVKYSGWEY